MRKEKIQCDLILKWRPLDVPSVVSCLFYFLPYRLVRCIQPALLVLVVSWLQVDRDAQTRVSRRVCECVACVRVCGCVLDYTLSSIDNVSVKNPVDSSQWHQSIGWRHQGKKRKNRCSVCQGPLWERVCVCVCVSGGGYGSIRTEDRRFSSIFCCRSSYFVCMCVCVCV